MIASFVNLCLANNDMQDVKITLCLIHSLNDLIPALVLNFGIYVLGFGVFQVMKLNSTILEYQRY